MTTNLTELSQQVLKNYKFKANKQLAKKQGETGAFGTRRTNSSDKFQAGKSVTDGEIMARRSQGIRKVNKRLVTEEHRPVHQVAREIKREWGSKVNYGAKPYLDAMHSLNSHKDNYGQDSGKSVIAYFLSNATAYRGEKAKAHKAELKAMLKEDIDITEISKQKIGAYLNKARDSLQSSSFRKGLYSDPKDKYFADKRDDGEKVEGKRWRGIGMASRKLMKEDVDVQEGAKRNSIHKQIRKAVDQHDLTHSMSDDPGVYRRGRDQADDIDDMAKRIPKANFRRIWNKNADKKLRKPDNQDFHIKEATENDKKYLVKVDDSYAHHNGYAPNGRDQYHWKKEVENAHLFTASLAKTLKNRMIINNPKSTVAIIHRDKIVEASEFIGTKNPDTSGKPKPIYSIYQKLVKASKKNTASDATKDFAKRNNETLKNTTSHYNPNAGIQTK